MSYFPVSRRRRHIPIFLKRQDGRGGRGERGERERKKREREQTWLAGRRKVCGLVFLDFNGGHYSSPHPAKVHFLSSLVSMRFDKRGKGTKEEEEEFFIPYSSSRI